MRTVKLKLEVVGVTFQAWHADLARSGTRGALLFARRRCAADALEKRSNAGGRIDKSEG